MNRVISKNQFWAISDQGFNTILGTKAPENVLPIPEGMVNKDFFREALSPFINQRQPMTAQSGIALIHLYGPMVQDASPLELAHGITGYEEIREDIAAANADESVKAIILVSDTPGGTVSGVEETYQAIKDSEKPVYGYNAGSATSAGYYLIAATEQIAVSPSSISGNIGAVLDFWDLSGVYESMGAKREVLTNEGADLKGTMRGPLSDGQREFLQDQINSMGEQFRQRVEENRHNLDEEVYRAGWYGSHDSMALGLVDYEGSLEEFVQLVSTEVDIRTENQRNENETD